MFRSWESCVRVVAGGTTVRTATGRRVAAGTIAILATVGMAGLTALPTPAYADEDEPDAHEVEITDTALYASPVTEAIPDTLTSEVPPTALCVLEPALCPEDLDTARDLLRSTVTTVLDEVPSEPLHPVPPDSIAVSFLGGNTRYQSALLVDVPAPPPGHEFQRVELVLPQGQPSYHLDSPAFRHVVLGTFAAIGDSDPELAVEGITEALTEEDLVSTEQLLGIEVCPLTVAFEPEGAPMAYSDEELPREAPDDDADEDALGEVAVECMLGADGTYDEDDEVWRFDITFAAQAWTDGDIDNLGLLFSPSGAPNLAFGDPDTSTNAQVVMDITEASLVLETFDATPPDPPEGSEGPGAEGPPSGDGDGIGDDTSSGGGGGAPPPSSGGSSGGGGGGSAPPPSSGGGGGGAAPGGGGDAGPAADMDEPIADEGVASTAGEGEDTQAIAATEETGIQRPWWLWLLIPVILGGAYLTHFSLVGTSSASKTPRGALARLTPSGRASRG